MLLHVSGNAITCIGEPKYKTQVLREIIQRRAEFLVQNSALLCIHIIIYACSIMSLFAFLPCLRQKLTCLRLQNWFACETDAQLLEYLSVHFAQHNRAMNLTAT